MYSARSNANDNYEVFDSVSSFGTEEMGNSGVWDPNQQQAPNSGRSAGGGKKLTIAQKAFLRNAGGANKKKQTAGETQKAWGVDVVVGGDKGDGDYTDSDTSDGEMLEDKARRREKMRAYKSMHRRRERELNNVGDDKDDD